MCANLVNMWRDEIGKTLQDYWRPSVAVDVALLTVTSGSLSVLLHKPDSGFAAGKWCLPGTFLHDGERLEDAALRALRQKVGVSGQAPRQLRVFDAVDRDERGRVLSIAHVDVLPEHRFVLSGVSWALAPIEGERAVPAGTQRNLPYDHDLIVAEAVRWVRTRYRRRPDPFRLAGKTFTLSDLQRTHESVEGQRLVKDTFRRHVLPALEPTGEERTGTVGRPAAVYRHKRRSG